jgi:FAD/FMN-containing dehydrogenase
MPSYFTYIVVWFAMIILNQQLTMASKYFYLNIYYLAVNLKYSLSELRCRCLASNSTCWPNASAWQQFDKSIDGRLVFPKPSAAVCDGATYNATACAVATAEWSNGMWRSDQAGALQNHNWENSSCSIYAASPQCNQGSVPVVGVNATLPEHVQATVSFAAANNLRLVIKNTGHDYLGRSTAAGSLLLWLHYMKNMTLIEQYSSCGLATVSNAVRLGAGVQWIEAYTWLNEFNLIAIGGAAGSVGSAGGYMQGGGHSPLSRWKGLAPDQVLEYDVVMANGSRQTVNTCQNGDLFWALRGGGGGTYAIVLSVVLRTYPSPSIAAASYGVTAPNQTRYNSLIADFVRFLSTAADAGWTGYFTMVDLTLSGIFHVPNGNLTEVTATMSEFAANNTDLDFGNTTFFSVPSFYYYFSLVLEPSNPTGFDVLLSSRLIPEIMVRSQPETVAAIFVQANGQSANGSSLLGHLVAGGQVANISNTNNSVNPGWRTALLHMVCTQAWDDTTSDAIQRSLATQVSLRAQMLNGLSDGLPSSCYMNEADPNDVNWKETYFGANYDRLKSIKETVDPNGLFVCKNCVGSEDWTTDLNCPSNSNKHNLMIFVLFVELLALFGQNMCQK